MHEKKNTILVVDHLLSTQKMLTRLLEAEHFKVLIGDTGKQGIRLCASIKPDLVLLDFFQPDMDGVDLIKTIRSWTHVPLIMLSEAATNQDIVDALMSGANDFIEKPFNSHVLLARIHAALRTSAVRETGEPVLCNGSLRMDLVRHEVFVNVELTAFTPKEYDLLRFLMMHRGKMLPHKDILHAVWGIGHGDDTIYLRVYISQIREKIETDPSHPVMIKTVSGIGYRMEIFENTLHSTLRLLSSPPRPDHAYQIKFASSEPAIVLRAMN